MLFFRYFGGIGDRFGDLGRPAFVRFLFLCEKEGFFQAAGPRNGPRPFFASFGLKLSGRCSALFGGGGGV